MKTDNAVFGKGDTAEKMVKIMLFHSKNQKDDILFFTFSTIDRAQGVNKPNIFRIDSHNREFRRFFTGRNYGMY